ncbi:hypothetical protein VMCG_03827 [Cytospora schulzeri]|uniref:Protein kinase domain-containing protein n=1 Tax=Cytospora schulzeri TaxID=448051 RepID=A0A423WUL1_9PEZI|nr:hypothetical protein VMCG_03827 [Valsa malicola]
MNDSYSPQGLEDYIASYAYISHHGITHKIDTHHATTTQGAITDPEGRLAPAELAPWHDGRDLLDDIFHCLRDLDTAENEASVRFPCRNHVEEKGHELSIINSEAAVHLFDVDTVYKPAKRIIDAALARPSMRAAISSVLRHRGYEAATPSTQGQGEVVFSPHSRTVTVPVHIAGQKRKRSPSVSDSEGTASNMGETMGETEQVRTEDEIRVSNDMTTNQPSRADVDSDDIRMKSGPGDYYCSFVSSLPRSVSSMPSSRLLIVGEAKAPHKLTRRLIESAVRGNNVTINIRQFIQHTENSSGGLRPPAGGLTAEPGDRLYSQDQRWLAAVATQIYSTLVAKKLRYGYITTGESYILLRIRPGHATAVDYLFLPALRQPASTRDNGQGDRAWLAATPLARLSCLALLSLFGDRDLTDEELVQAKSSKTSMIWQDPRHREQSLESGSLVSSVASGRTKGTDPDWTGSQDTMDDEDAMDNEAAFDAQGTQGPQGPQGTQGIQGTQGTPPQTPYSTHKRARCTNPSSDTRRVKRVRMSPLSASMASGITAPSLHHDDPHQPLECLTPPPEMQPLPQDSGKADDKVQNISIDVVPFCTSRCIQSMLHSTGTDLDSLCPNQATHQQHQRLQTLAQSVVTLPQFLPDPSNTEHDPPVLIRNPTANSIYTGQYGATSAIFKIRIEPGGYVLVAKAARSKDMIRRLEREERVYKKLRSLQGHVIPVCMGLVNITEDAIPGFAQFPTCLLLSWAGSSLLDYSRHDNPNLNSKRLRADVDEALTRVHGLGVLHQDAELRNLLITDSGVIVVDFERATTRGGFSRRAADKGNVETAFRRACDREREICLAQLDQWSQRMMGDC